MLKNRYAYWSILIVLSIIIATCAGVIIYKLVTDARDKTTNDDIRTMKESAVTDSARPPVPSQVTIPFGTEPTVPPDNPVDDRKMLSQLHDLYNLNNDMVGWIEIPGTAISYPVVQSKYQANYYLRRNFYKKNATCGTIYVREACDVFKPSDNVTIYGHKMRNGTMFADLHQYKDKDFWKDHRYIYFDTLYEYHTYEVFAVFQTTADLAKGFSYHLFDDAKNAAEYDEFVSKCKELSDYDTGITPAYGQKLITLSTCDKSIEDGRFVVVACRVV